MKLHVHANNVSVHVLLGKKRKRCGTCPGCVAEDCQKCPMCLDKPKYGGKGKKKQCCVKRRCSGKPYSYNIVTVCEGIMQIFPLNTGLCPIITPLSSVITLTTTASNAARDRMLKVQ